MSSKRTKFILLVTAILASASVRAEDARLSIESDLIIHPEDISTVLERSVAELNKKKILDWDVMTFSKPLRSRLLALMTVNPMIIGLDALDPVKQTVQFAANWDDPGVNIGRLEIDDHIKRTVNGVNIILDLKAACENLKMRMPGARWRISGEMKWKWVGSQPVFEISSLSLYKQDVNMDIEFGQCDAPVDMQDEMKKSVSRVLSEDSRLEGLFREGLLRWVNNQFSNVDAELTTPREYLTANNLKLKWLPEKITSVQGVILVRGHMELSRSGLATASVASVLRDSAMQDPQEVKSSGFLLPQAALTAISNFIYSSELVNRRISSKSIAGLQTLIKSRFGQALYWPDLNRFPTSVEFLFDLSARAAPRVKGALTSGNGIAVMTVIPLSIRQWAPDPATYVHYVDFTSDGVGEVNLNVKNAMFTVGFSVDKLNLAYKYDANFVSKHSGLNPRIKISTFEEKIKDSLLNKFWQFKLPEITLPGKQLLGLGGIEMVDQGVLLRMDSRPIP